MPTSIEHDHPLARLSKERDAVTRIVCSKIVGEHPQSTKAFRDTLSESLFLESKRLETPADPVRDAVDQAFWGIISKELHGAEDEVSLKLLLERLTRFHMGEIMGNFDERTYKIATTVVPRGFYWLLQAMSLRGVAGAFKQKIDLRGKVVIQGELDQIRTLSKKGTVLLVPTHSSNLDSILMGWALFDVGLPPFAYGAGLNLFTNPILGYFMSNLGAYRVDRQKKHGLYKNILKEFSTTILERGVHSLFFPGGGRSRSGGLERHIKMGLLGTGLSAYTRNLIAGRSKPDVFVVPCTISYHSVLEAGSLINEYLREQGKSRYLPIDADSITAKDFTKFIYNFFSTSTKIHVNFGRALDVFGHIVDNDGNSLNHSGRVINRQDYVKSGGEIVAVRQRDEEYTKVLADRIVHRYEKENVALSSHFLAYCLFRYIVKKYPERDLYRIVQNTPQETMVPFEDFLNFCIPALDNIHALYKSERLHLEPGLRTHDVKQVVQNGLRHLGVLHAHRPAVLKEHDGKTWIYSQDIKLLYYYHNRIAHHEIIP